MAETRRVRGEAATRLVVHVDGGVLRLDGEADLSTEHLVRDGVARLVASTPPHRVDLSRLTFVDARCLGILLDGEVPLELRDPRPNVARLLDVLAVHYEPQPDPA